MVFLVDFTRVNPPPALLVVPHRQQQWPPFPQTTSFFLTPNRTLPRRIHSKNRRWDSNAETFRSRNFDFDSADDGDDDFEDDDDDDTNQWLDILEDFIDVQVFRSFGWLLPAIISSLLLTSGPKAFLMALAIPVGQSALSLLFQTVWGRPKNRRGQRKSKRKPQPPPPPPPRRRPAASRVDMDDQEEYVKGERKAATGYQTWVAGDGGSSDNSSSSFGGWEELDGRSKPNKDGKRKTSKSKMSRRERSETPLLLRLLIAVFPFIGSWTRML